MKWIRIFFSIVILLVLVVAGGIASILYFIDPNKLRPAIVEQVMQKTGYELAIYDKLSWSIYPRVGINIVRMTLTAPEQVEPFLDLHNIVIGTDMLDLIKGKKELQGDLRIANLKFNGVQAQNARVVLRWDRNNVLTMQPIVTYLYGGVLHGVATGRDLDKKPEWTWDLRLNHVQAEPLIRDATFGKGKIAIAGVMQALFQANARGMSQDEIINTMNGKMGVMVQDGYVTGINLNYLIQTADQMLNKQPVTAPTESLDKTNYDRISGSFAIKDGMAVANDLYMTSPVFIAKASGNYVLLTQGMNINLKVTPQQEPIQWEIPVLISGNLSDPYIRLDTLEIQKIFVKQEGEKIGNKVRDEVKEHVKGKAGEILQNIIGS